MSFLELVSFVVGAVIVGPVVALVVYVVIRVGAAGYFKSKRQFDKPE